MIHIITSLRFKEYGLFADVASGDAFAVNTRNGDVLFHHQGMPGLIPASQCRGFQIKKQGLRRSTISVIFSENSKLKIGYTLNSINAKKWVEAANAVITKAHSSSTKTKLAMPKAKPAEATNRASFHKGKRLQMTKVVA